MREIKGSQDFLLGCIISEELIPACVKIMKTLSSCTYGCLLYFILPILSKIIINSGTGTVICNIYLQ